MTPTAHICLVNAEMALAKHELNQVKAKVRLLQQEKRNIYDQISAADELKKQQQVRQPSFSACERRHTERISVPCGTVLRISLSASNLN